MARPLVPRLALPLPKEGPASLPLSPHRVFPVDCRHSEVSPLTTEDPKDACDSSSEPDVTLTTSDLPTEQPPAPRQGWLPPQAGLRARLPALTSMVPIWGRPTAAPCLTLWASRSPHKQA